MKKERISIEDLEKMVQCKYICTTKINFKDSIFGDNQKHLLTFDVFDGFAYCADYQGKEYYMTYPKKKFVEASTTMNKNVREFLDLDEHEPLTELHCLAGYMTINQN